MQYFLIGPDNDPVLLGEISMSETKFFMEPTFGVLQHMVDNNPELIEHVKIVTDSGKHLTIEEFLSILKSLKMIK